MSFLDSLPVAIIGAGPVGLAAAAHLINRGLPVKVYEAGPTVAASVRSWGHVRLFSPWKYNVDAAAGSLLARHGWQEPADDTFPTGEELYTAYLKPLAALPEMAAVIETGTRVCAISRHGIDKVVTRGREKRPFLLSVSNGNGSLRRDLARAVIDASGTWKNPNPLGAAGVAASGEIENAHQISYGLPDVRGRHRGAYAGRTAVVIGGGHSAANVLLDLAHVAEQDSRTTIVWAVRGTNLARLYGGGHADQLPARGELGARVKELVDDGRITLVTGFAGAAVRTEGERVIVEGETAAGTRRLGPADRIVVATGQRPNLALTRELRIDLDPWLECAKALGPLIDPNLHSCGSVPPHGHRELSHPEPGFYTAGVKSYGRAPTFLMVTGYEQVRSVAAAIAGDTAAADDTRLVLPETGVCSTQISSEDGKAAAGCCGGPAPKEADGCCVADVAAKAATGKGCGCGSAPQKRARRPEAVV
jgi:thioredoxin reductase